MASLKTIEIVKSTAPVLKEHGATITKVFYRMLFENHPELKDVFNMTHQKKGSQPKVLANAIFQYATYIDQLDALGDAVKSITQKHVSLSVTPEMYPIVGKYLLLAIKDVLGDAATDEIIDAWAEAYTDLAGILINVEEEVYKKAETKEGGFRGHSNFVVIKKVKESTNVISFYLKNTSIDKVPEFISGQYVAVTVAIPGEEHKHTRNYSLSDVSGKDYLRISVKKEELNPKGIVSNYLHDSVNVGDSLTLGIPSGVFTLKETKNPILLIAGGIGITPLMSMYNTLAENKLNKITFINCAINSNYFPFKEEISKGLTSSNINIVTVFSDPLESDQKNKNFDYQGFVNNSIISKYITKDTEVYFCGPTPFMSSVLSILKELKTPETNINYEFFGPEEELQII